MPEDQGFLTHQLSSSYSARAKFDHVKIGESMFQRFVFGMSGRPSTKTRVNKSGEIKQVYVGSPFDPNQRYSIEISTSEDLLITFESLV